MRRRTASLAVVLSLGVGVGGCAAILPPGPMQLGGDPGGVCVRSGGELVVVGDQFMIEGEAKAELTSVQLVNSSGLDLEEAFVIPIDGATMGTARYPPDINTWDQRVSVTEAVISPGEWMTFALVLKPVGTSGHTADGFRVSYEVAGSNFEKSNSTEYELAASCE